MTLQPVQLGFDDFNGFRLAAPYGNNTCCDSFSLQHNKDSGIACGGISSCLYTDV